MVFLKMTSKLLKLMGTKLHLRFIDYMRSVFEKKFPTAEKIPRNWTDEEINGKKHSRFLCYQLTTTNLDNHYKLHQDINKKGHWILYSQDEKDLSKMDKINAVIEPNIGTLIHGFRVQSSLKRMQSIIGSIEEMTTVM